jgi:hypothetical protein
MCRRKRGVLPRPHRMAGLVALLIAAPAHAQPIVPRPIESFAYQAAVTEDPAAKVCQLGLALRDGSAGAGVNFQLMVAQMKRDGAPAGPLVTGFTVDRRSVAFMSERYTSVALPKAAPFQDGSVAASTLDFVEGRELIAAVLRADFELSFTRANSNAVESYRVGSPPPADVLAEFSACVGSLASL